VRADGITHKLRDRCCRSDRSGRDKRRRRSSRGLGPWAGRRRWRGPTEAHLRSIRGEIRECRMAQLVGIWSGGEEDLPPRYWAAYHDQPLKLEVKGKGTERNGAERY